MYQTIATQSKPVASYEVLATVQAPRKYSTYVISEEDVVRGFFKRGIRIIDNSINKLRAAHPGLYRD